MREHDPARKAVEILAASVKVPPAPEGLVRPGPRRSSAARFLLAASLLLGVVLAVWLVQRPEAPQEVPAAKVVVEHLRLRGETVSTRIVEMPGTDAIVVVVAKKTSSALRRHPGDGPVAVACGIPEWRVLP